MIKGFEVLKGNDKDDEDEDERDDDDAKQMV